MSGATQSGRPRNLRDSRARFLRLAAGAAASVLLAPPGFAQRVSSAQHAIGGSMHSRPMLARPIPATGEALPIVGCGTYLGFDVEAGSPGYRALPAVLQALFDAGGSVLDSSPMYGRSEAVTGELLAASGSRKHAFLATKVWIRGRDEGSRQMQESMRLLQTDVIDLMQVHNLVDWRTQLDTIRDWKAQGRIRYVGVTHYTAGAYRELEAVLRAEPLDFVQLNYALDDREAEQRLLPLAADRGTAVLVNRPFGGGGLLRRLRNRSLPGWAAEIGAESWAQLLLKFVLAHPAVTCAIPGTGRPEHMADNAKAGTGIIPDRAFWAHHAASLPI